jgi:hypothetical protein
VFYMSATLSVSMLGQHTQSIRSQIHGDFEGVKSSGRVEWSSS